MTGGTSDSSVTRVKIIIIGFTRDLLMMSITFSVDMRSLLLFLAGGEE
jgi:hypothetical protein